MFQRVGLIVLNKKVKVYHPNFNNLNINVSDRIITARSESRFKKVSIIMRFAPTNTSEEEEKDSL